LGGQVTHLRLGLLAFTGKQGDLTFEEADISVHLPTTVAPKDQLEVPFGGDTVAERLKIPVARHS
jgi:hypothetical protein